MNKMEVFLNNLIFVALAILGLAKTKIDDNTIWRGYTATDSLIYLIRARILTQASIMLIIYKEYISQIRWCVVRQQMRAMKIPC